MTPPIKQRSNRSATYYPNQYYEQCGGTNIGKYYVPSGSPNGQPIALRRNGAYTTCIRNRDPSGRGNMALVTSGGAKVDTQGFYTYACPALAAAPSCARALARYSHEAG